MNQSPSILCIRRMQDLGGSHEMVGLSVMPTVADSLRTAARLSTTHRKGIVPIYIYTHTIIASVSVGDGGERHGAESDAAEYAGTPTSVVSLSNHFEGGSFRTV